MSIEPSRGLFLSEKVQVPRVACGGTTWTSWRPRSRFGGDSTAWGGFQARRGNTPQWAGRVRDDAPEDLVLTARAMVHGLSALGVEGQLRHFRRARMEDLGRTVTQVLYLRPGPRG